MDPTPVRTDGMLTQRTTVHMLDSNPQHMDPTSTVGKCIKTMAHALVKCSHLLLECQVIFEALVRPLQLRVQLLDPLHCIRPGNPAGDLPLQKVARSQQTTADGSRAESMALRAMTEPASPAYEHLSASPSGHRQ